VPLEHALGPELGTFVKDTHASHGVQFHLEESPARIDDANVVLASGVTLPADLVVIGIGVRPATELAEAAGLAVDRGILVNEQLETAVPGIFAAGDVARYADRISGERIRVEHWVLAQRHGRTAALNMLGSRQPFTGVPFFWSNHYDVSIRFTGYAGRGATRRMSGTPGSRECTVAYEHAGRITALATIGRDRAGLAAEADLEASAQIDVRSLSTL